MFNWFTKILIATSLGLCGWIWVQSSEISSLVAKNQTQAQTIRDKEQEIANLQTTVAAKIKQINEERQAAEEQSKVEKAEKVKADEDIKIIYKSLSTSQCSKVVMPSDVINSISGLQYN